MKLFCVGHIHQTYSYILMNDPPHQFATFWWSTIILLKKGETFGGRDVVKSFKFHTSLMLSVINIFTQYLFTLCL